jgi:hypothetical protein
MSRRAALSGLALATVVVMALAFAAGRATAAKGAGAPEAAPGAPRASSSSSGVLDGVVAVGWPDTEEGALGAATSYVEAVESDLVLDPARFRRVLERLSDEQAWTSRLSQQIEASLVALNEARPVLTRTGQGKPAALRGWVLTRRLRSFTPEVAAVEVWFVQAIYDGETHASFFDVVLTLRWEGDWRILAIDPGDEGNSGSSLTVQGPTEDVPEFLKAEAAR